MDLNTRPLSLLEMLVIRKRLENLESVKVLFVIEVHRLMCMGFVSLVGAQTSFFYFSCSKKVEFKR